MSHMSTNTRNASTNTRNGNGNGNASTNAGTSSTLHTTTATTATTATSSAPHGTLRRTCHTGRRFDSADNAAHAAIGVILALLFILSCPDLFSQELPPVDPLPDKVCSEEDYATVTAAIPPCGEGCYTLASCVSGGGEPWNCEACLDIAGEDSGTFADCTGASAQPGLCRIK